MIELKTLKLEQINYENIEHLEFLKDLMKSKDIYYLWDLSDSNLLSNKNKDKYLVLNSENEKIGYINISNSTEAYYGNTVSIYYAVDEKYRGNQYGKKIIEEVNDWLMLTKNIDCIVAQAEPSNIHSFNTLKNAGMECASTSEEYITFIQRKNR